VALVSAVVGDPGGHDDFGHCLVVLNEHHHLLEELGLLVAAQLYGAALLVDDGLYLVC
jgi:hypothetical protein